MIDPTGILIIPSGLSLEKRRKLYYNFVSQFIQGGRSKPKKFKHSLKMPFDLYNEMKDCKVFDPEFLYSEETAFFEFSSAEDSVTISFMNLFQAEDLHRKIDHYLVVKFSGSYPIERFGIFF